MGMGERGILVAVFGVGFIVPAGNVAANFACFLFPFNFGEVGGRLIGSEVAVESVFEFVGAALRVEQFEQTVGEGPQFFISGAV